MKIQIDTGIPIPKESLRRLGPEDIVPVFRKMKVGDSFHLPFEIGDPPSEALVLRIVGAAADRVRNFEEDEPIPDLSWVWVEEPGGVRVWRTY